MKTKSYQKIIFSPAFIYLAGFLFPFSLVFIGFSRHVGPLSSSTLYTIGIGIVGFYLGIISIKPFDLLLSKKHTPQTIKIKNEYILFLFLFSFWIICFSMLWFEFYQLGSIPLFSKNVEELRFKMQYNGYTHLLAINSGFLAFIFFCFSLITSKNKLKYIYLTITLITLFCLALTANRMDFLYPLFLIFIYYILLNERIFNLKNILYALLGVCIFVSLNILRSLKYSSKYIEDNITGLGHNFEPTAINLAFYPLYMTLTYSYEMLNKLVNAGIENTTQGLYTFTAFISIFPIKIESFGDFKNRMLEIDFYAELTSTYLSNFYVDFGNIGVFILSFAYALTIQTIWNLYLRSRKFIFLYTVAAAPLFFTFYAFYYIYFYAFFQIFIILFVMLFLKNQKEQ